MIDINDYNRKDLIVSCLIEAANIMSENYDDILEETSDKPHLYAALA